MADYYPGKVMYVENLHMSDNVGSTDPNAAQVNASSFDMRQEEKAKMHAMNYGMRNQPMSWIKTSIGESLDTIRLLATSELVRPELRNYAAELLLQVAAKELTEFLHPREVVSNNQEAKEFQARASATPTVNNELDIPCVHKDWFTRFADDYARQHIDNFMSIEILIRKLREEAYKVIR